MLTFLIISNNTNLSLGKIENIDNALNFQIDEPEYDYETYATQHITHEFEITNNLVQIEAHIPIIWSNKFDKLSYEREPITKSDLKVTVINSNSYEFENSQVTQNTLNYINSII